MFDEFAEAQALDPRRARAIAALILEQGRESGLLKECAADDKPPEEALVALDAWLCDMKEMRIGDGLHVFGRSPESADGFAAGLDLDAAARDTLSERVAASGAAESLGLLRALGGRFVPPGPAGAPARGRLDVLPTGRNLYAIDPRSAPTRNAWEIGRRAAEEICKRYAQDHGEWPKRIVLDLWGSATMRTGGDDLAQAFALIGCRPTWDAASTRVNGFEVLPLAMLGRPRVDVTLRISGLFRDVFPSQIALFAAAVRAVAALEESAEDNPLAGLRGRRRASSARRQAAMASGSARVSRGASGRIGPNWRRPISPRPATPMMARAKRAKRRRSFERGSPAPRPSFMRRTCPARTRSTPTPSPSMKAASPPQRRKRERIRRSIISTRPSPARPRSEPWAKRSRALSGDAPPIRAGFRARCATAIAARRKSPSRWTISIVSPP